MFMKYNIMKSSPTSTNLVSKARAEAVHDSAGGQVFGSNELQTTPLAPLLSLDDVIQLGVVLQQGGLTGEGSGDVSEGSHLMRVEIQWKDKEIMNPGKTTGVLQFAAAEQHFDIRRFLGRLAVWRL
jgi:hypothetical protein